MRVLAVGFATYVGALFALSLVAVYLLRPVAAELRGAEVATDVATDVAWYDSAVEQLAALRTHLVGHAALPDAAPPPATPLARDDIPPVAKGDAPPARTMLTPPPAPSAHVQAV